jgi:hypothetical protein
MGLCINVFVCVYICRLHGNAYIRIGKSVHRSIFFIASGVGLSPLYCGHFWPIVPASDDRWGWLWSNWWNEDWRYDSNSIRIWWGLQITKHIIMQLSLNLTSFHPFQVPQHPFLNLHLCSHPNVRDPSFTHIQNYRKNYYSVYFNLYFLMQWSSEGGWGGHGM